MADSKFYKKYSLKQMFPFSKTDSDADVKLMCEWIQEFDEKTSSDWKLLSTHPNSEKIKTVRISRNPCDL